MPKGAANKRARHSAGSSANVTSILSDVANLAGGGSNQTDQLVAAFMTAITKLGEVVAKFDDTLDSINDRLEKVEAELHEVKIERDNLLTANKKLQKEIEAKTVQLEVDTELRQRERRASNIKITGLDAGNKTNANIISEVIKLHNDHVDDDNSKLDDGVITHVQIIKGRIANDKKKPDAIIITLQNPSLKKRFYALSKKMRESKNNIFIGDDLTVGQRKLMFELKKRVDLFNGAVIRDGAVRCFKKGGGIRQFAYLHELDRTALLSPIE